jgi:DNA-directed RNA polymerase specialized sigma subunit
MTQAQIGKQVGVSQMQVSRVLRRATERLRKLAAAEGDAH